MDDPNHFPFRRTSRSLLFLAAIVMALNLPMKGRAQPLPLGPTQFLSGPGLQQATSGTDSFSPFFTEDGRFLFFQSQANDLVAGDTDVAVLDLFRYDLAADALIRVSDGDSDWDSPSASRNGEQIVYSSVGASTVRNPNGNTRIKDIYLRDLKLGSTLLISASTNRLTGGNADSIRPLISANGQSIAFESYASDLADEVPASSSAGVPRRWIYIKDIHGDRAKPTPVLKDGQELFSHHHSASFSADGRRLAFTREIRFPRPSNGTVVVMDVPSGEILWWSTNYVTTTAPRAAALAPQMSRDGRLVAFLVLRPSGDLVVLHDLETGNDRVMTNSLLAGAPVVFSSDQSHLIFERLFEIGSWDLRSDEQKFFRIASPVSVAGQARWAQVVTDASGSTMLYRGDVRFVEGGSGLSQPAIYLRRLSDSEPILISKNPDGIASAPESIGDPAISPDGRWVAFQASDSDLVNADRNRATDIFLGDLQTGSIRLISRHGSNTHPPRTPSTVSFGMPAMAADGETFVFSAGDGNLTPFDTNNSVDVFRQVGEGGPMVRLTDNAGIPSKFYQRYVRPQISADGNAVAFVGQQSVAATGFTVGSHLYHLNIPSGKSQLITAATGPIPPLIGGEALGRPKSDRAIFSLSADGRWVAYQNFATEGVIGVYLWDVERSTNMLLGVQSAGTTSVDVDSNPLVSSDGRQVLFVSTATDLLVDPPPFGIRLLYLRDVVAGKTRLVSPFGSTNSEVEGYVMSADAAVAGWWHKAVGGIVTLGDVVLSDLRIPGDARTIPGLFRLYGINKGGQFAVGLFREDPVTNLLSGQLCRLDVKTGAIIPFNAGTQYAAWSTPSLASSPVISADGRFIAFESDDGSLVPGDKNGTTDVFVRDVAAGVTILVSVNRQGTQSGNGPSSTPVLAADGQTLMFRSWASDLSAGDFNNTRDFFTLRLSAGDSDDDGLPDDWELAYFANLDRDGSGDFDGDGVSDSAEYTSGTDPTNQGSVLRAMILQNGATGGHRTLLWSAVPGKMYQIQSREKAANGVWVTISDVLSPSTTTGSWTDPNSSLVDELYYRVILVE